VSRSSSALRLRSVTRSKRRTASNPRDEKAARLLEATDRLLAKGSSFTELSIETICREAGIGRSTYYVYFRDKGHLLRKITEQLTDEMLEGSRAWWDVAAHATEAQLREAMIETLHVYRRHQTLFGALAETSSYDEEAKAALDSLNSRYAQQLLQAIEPGRNAGFVRPDIDEATALALVWTCERISYRLARRDDEQLVQAAEIIAKILWRTLYTGDRGPLPR
jgi:TetR/AcrR family transcriptional regulator, ethionamide resistance regulator